MNRAQVLVTVQVVFLVVLQVATVVVLWLVNPLTQSQTDAYALFLSIDLVAFVIISYTYRALKNNASPNSIWLSLGYLVIILLLVTDILAA